MKQIHSGRLTGRNNDEMKTIGGRWMSKSEFSDGLGEGIPTDKAYDNDDGLEALSDAWGEVLDRIDLPVDYDGTATPEAHEAIEALQERIRCRLIASGDRRLFSLLHLLGQASLKMEQSLWPEAYEEMCCAIEASARSLAAPGAKAYTHDEVSERVRLRLMATGVAAEHGSKELDDAAVGNRVDNRADGRPNGVSE